MIRGIKILAAIAPIAAVALAPHGARAADNRLVMHAYSDAEVVRIEGRPGVQATIAFGEGEAIENVAIGDSVSWQVTPNKRADLLFVKPIEAGARTNMTVVTDRHTYLFDLIASAKAVPVYLLRFTYKDAPKQPARGTPIALTPAEQAAMVGADGLPTDPAMLNFAWRPKGDARVLPARVYDDGSATYLLWGEKSQIPAILTLNEKGEEGPLNYAVRGRTIVIDDVPGTILLRSGRARATLVNSRPIASTAASEAAAPTPGAPSSTDSMGGPPATSIETAAMAAATPLASPREH